MKLEILIVESKQMKNRTDKTKKGKSIAESNRKLDE